MVRMANDVEKEWNGDKNEPVCKVLIQYLWLSYNI